MALAEAINVTDLGERRWAEWWADPGGDIELGAALLDVFEAWDGDDSLVTESVHERFKAPFATRNSDETIRQAGVDEDHDGDQADIVIERNWHFVGVGYFDTDTAARALAAAALAREHR
jgi:hypothetical protein